MVMAFGASCGFAHGQTTEVLDAALRAYNDAAAADGPVRNFVFLYLRVAGVAWIAVEWAAAVILVLAYRQMQKAFPPRREVS